MTYYLNGFRDCSSGGFKPKNQGRFEVCPVEDQSETLLRWRKAGRIASQPRRAAGNAPAYSGAPFSTAGQSRPVMWSMCVTPMGFLCRRKSCLRGPCRCPSVCCLAFSRCTVTRVGKRQKLIGAWADSTMSFSRSVARGTGQVRLLALSTQMSQ